MKLSCTKENLNQGLAITSHVSARNVNLPILNNVLLRADAGGLKLISTNLEIAITCTVRGKLEQQGEYTVPSKLFYDFVNLLPNERVDIDLHDDVLSVKCGSAKTKIKGISPSEFPLVPPVVGKLKYIVPVHLLRGALSRVLFATATNESRPELTGVIFSFNGGGEDKGLILAATDSYRLAEVYEKISVEGTEQKVIIPQRTLTELSRMFGVFKDDVEAPKDVIIELADNQVVFRYGSVELISRTIEGNYPDYRQIIPNTSKTEIIIERTVLSQAIKSASLFSKLGLFDIDVKINPTDKTIELSAADSGRGENKITLEAEVSGDENEIIMNYRYLLDGLNAMPTEKVKIKIIDAASPCVIVPAEEMPNEKYQYIVMPIRQ